MEQKWSNHKGNINLVSPANKRPIDVIVVGTGLAGASASATLAELGYNVKSFLFKILQDALIQLQRKANSAAKTIKEMGILFTDCFMILLRAGTIGLERQMFTD